jgi:hypothetical protein
MMRDDMGREKEEKKGKLYKFYTSHRLCGRLCVGHYGKGNQVPKSPQN